MKQPKKRLSFILILEFLAVIGVIAAYLLLDVQQVYEWFSEKVIYAKSNQPCDLHQAPCHATLPDGSHVTFSITPQTIPVVEPLTYEVNTTGISAETLKLEIYGLNMDMGRYGSTLKKLEEGQYQGNGMLPTCVGRMYWRANLIVRKPEGLIGTWFEFTTQ